MKMIRNAVMRTAKGILRPGERKNYSGVLPAGWQGGFRPPSQVRHQSYLEQAAPWERWRLAGVLAGKSGRRDAGAPRKGQARSVFDGGAQNIGEDLARRLVGIDF
ncbi:MAG TPA: hypothetical protein VFI23_16780, partial [Rhizomicrobium sp.]|nr:hypothetical protein [Rhizomicrobium sp.]